MMKVPQHKLTIELISDDLANITILMNKITEPLMKSGCFVRLEKGTTG